MPPLRRRADGHSQITATPVDGTRSPSSERQQIFTDSYTSNRSSRASSVCSTPDSPSVLDRKSENVFTNLENYVAVGSLRIAVECFDNLVQSPQVLEVLPVAKIPPPPPIADMYPFLTHLLSTGWVRLFLVWNEKYQQYRSIRCFILAEDVCRRHVDRSDRALRKSLKTLFAQLDVAPETWKATHDPDTPPKHIFSNAQSDESLSSLFYLYNTLESPDPSSAGVQDKHTKVAMDILLDPSDAPDGLKTTLYPYQRRSAAMMLQKENAPTLQLDPRLREMVSLDGRRYYFDHETMGVLLHPRLYEEARGGILAETMGLGKTLICLAVILASKGHWPRIPAEYSTDLHPRREKVASLLDMTASTIGRYSIPWKTHFETLADAGEDHSRCIEVLKENTGRYEIPGIQPRSLRATVIPRSRPIRLSTATLIIVPANLVNQWLDEMKKHTKDGCLSILVMDSLKKELPDVETLAEYDVILFSKPRWEREVRDGEDSKGRRAPRGKQLSCACPYIGATRNKRCDCFIQGQVYSSPLKQIHWLRVIVDEGHSFASSGSKSNAVLVAGELQTDSRWIISGTPTKGLIGVEVDLAANEHQKVEWEQRDNLSPKTRRKALESRKAGVDWHQERKDVEKLGRIAVDYLKLRPWANIGSLEPAPAWMWHMYQQSGSAGAFAGYSECLKRTLKGLIVKHRPEDFEVDVQLPPLYNQLVHLEPAFYDRLSINLFLAVLTTNAVTSEREDTDYLWHPRNRKSLNTLVSNLRQSGFFWTGFSENDVSEALKHAEGYLESKKDECPDRDRNALNKALAVGRMALQSTGWRAFSKFHELGMFVEKWPEEHAVAWALDSQPTSPMILGITQLIKAQKYVNSQLYASDPSSGLSIAGQSAMQAALDHAKTHDRDSGTKDKGISTSSSLQEAPAPSTPKKRRASTQQRSQTPTTAIPLPTKAGLKSALKTPSAPAICPTLPSDSPLAQTLITGTASAKLSYLLDKILSLYKDEKILVFYEGEDIAYYIAQALEVVDIQYLIYAKSLSSERRASYVVTFNTTETFRVLLMDVNQASHGLNMSSASRVFFVNAIWQPNVEAQAIKRAHRIGQTRPVYVETLVLRDTIEDRMLQRRKSMTKQELQKAEKSLLDDNGMTSIIQHADFLPLSPTELVGPAQMAPLKHPQQVFARPTRCGIVNDDPDAGIVGILSSTASSTKKRRKNNSAGFMLSPDPFLFGGSGDVSSNNGSRMGSPAAPQRGIAFDTSEADQIRAAGGIIMEPHPRRKRSSPVKSKPKRTARFVLDVEDDSSDQPKRNEGSGPSNVCAASGNKTTTIPKRARTVSFAMEGVEPYSSSSSSSNQAASLASLDSLQSLSHLGASAPLSLLLHHDSQCRSPPPSALFTLSSQAPKLARPASPFSASGSTTATQTPSLEFSPPPPPPPPPPLQQPEESPPVYPLNHNPNHPPVGTPCITSQSHSLDANHAVNTSSTGSTDHLESTPKVGVKAPMPERVSESPGMQDNGQARRPSLFGGTSVPPAPAYRRPF